MKQAILVAPNLGASFAGGGGSSVAANLAQAILEECFDVSFFALSGYPNKVLDELHGTNLSTHGSALSSCYVFKRRFEDRGTHKAAKSSAISLMLLGFHNYLSLSIRRLKPSVVWFSDDVPRACEKILKAQHSAQYINFAYKTRLITQVDEQWENYRENKNFSVKQRSNKPRLAQLLVGNKAVACDTVIANSSVTSRYLKETECDVHPLTMYPPVRIVDHDVFRKRTNQIVAVGAFRPNKRFGDIIRALHLSKAKELRLVIVGLRDDDDYLNYLRQLVISCGLQKRVVLIPNATRATLDGVLAESSVILSAARFEPFGISIVEGMGNNCVPMVFAGEDSGPWVDIVQRGKFGYGFRDIEELSELLKSVSSIKDHKIRREVRARASMFNDLAFRERIKELIRSWRL